MNWGYKLILIFLCFGALIGYMVYRCTQVPVNLVSKDYYQDELEYQNVIDRKYRAGNLSSEVHILQDNQQLTIQLPAEMKHQNITGNVLFYCPSASAQDRKIPLQTDGNARQLIPPGLLQPGKYRAKINWESNNISYYAETELRIN